MYTYVQREKTTETSFLQRERGRESETIHSFKKKRVIFFADELKEKLFCVVCCPPPPEA